MNGATSQVFNRKTLTINVHFRSVRDFFTSVDKLAPNFVELLQHIEIMISFNLIAADEADSSRTHFVK